MIEPEELREQIFDKLRMVRDPGTFVDVISMRLIRTVDVKEGGYVSLILKPGSNVCPLAAKLATDIKMAVESVEGVNRVDVTIIDHINAEMLNRLLNE